MKNVDDDISEVEMRIARRRMSVELTARAAWRRTMARLVSPAGLLGAGALGLAAFAAIFRRRPKIIERRSSARAPAKWGSLLGVIASGAFTLLKARYGGPVEMASKLAAQIRSFKEKKGPSRPRSAVVH
ncbi:MAG: hypothetical protein JO035_11475 [Betaproteobacteria bacterium]|nr:hypothetical protein [Betaproteobacteria bacterium]